MCWLTVSKALDISSETRTVRAGGFWLKPSTIELVMLLRAVTVEWFGLIRVVQGYLVFLR